MVKSILIGYERDEEVKGLIAGFKNLGYNVTRACNGNETLKLLKKSRSLTAIILSADLTGVRTVEIYNRIKKLRQLQSAPVLILDNGGVDWKEFPVSKTDRVIPKPFSSIKLNHLINSLGPERPDVVVQVDFYRQVPLLIVIIFIAVAILLYFIIIPMFFGPAKGQKKNSRPFISMPFR